jgi:conjugative relaxase-like TrwC/TraI family protein
MYTTKTLYSPSETKRYYSSDRSKDYYVSKDREVVVSGSLMEHLGVTGFDMQQFFQLCDGINPKTGEKLTPGKRLRIALDATISAPKSVTDVIMLTGDERAFDAMSRANQDTMRLMEADASVRERVGGADYDRPTGNFIAYSFWDPTTRPKDGIVDPHGHWHNVIFNATYDPVKKRIMAAQLQRFDDNGKKLYRNYYQAFFNNQLRRYMEEIGYKTRDTKHAFEVVGVPQEAIDAFSRRTKEIDAEAKERGITSPEEKGKLGAKLRESKIPLQPWDTLVEGWRNRLNPEVLAEIERTYAESLKAPPPPELVNREAMDYALAHKHYRASAVPERELFIEAMKTRMGRVSLEGLKQEPDRPGLIREEIEGVGYVSSQAIKAEEDKVVAFATATRGKHIPLGFSDAKVPQHLPGTMFKPTKSQANAMRHIWNSRDPVTLVLGKPGVGKTELLKAVRPQLQVPSVFIAPTAVASRENLVEAGFIDANTVASFLGSKKLLNQARDGVVFLDEGSMAGSVDMARLVESATEHNFRLVVLGDRMQHKAVARGDTLKLLSEHAKLPHANLSEIVRQRGELLKTVEMFHSGKAAEGIRDLDRQGRVRIGSVDEIADAYANAVKAGRSIQVISPTHAGGREAAAAIRAILRIRGKVVKRKDGTVEVGLLKGDDNQFDTLRPLQFTPAEQKEKLAAGQVAQFHWFAKGGFKPGDTVAVTDENIEVLRAANPESYSLHMPDTTALAIGDRIRTTNNAEVINGRVQNGSLYEVAEFTDRGTRLTNGLILPTGFRNFTQGYVTTSPGSQSKTADDVLIWQPAATKGATGLEQSLVSVSRGAKNVLIVTDSKEWLPKAAERQDERVLALDLERARRERMRKRAHNYLAWMRGGVQRSHGMDRGLEVHRG